MKVLKTIQLPEGYTKNRTVEIREACRMVAFDNKDMIPIIFVGNGNYHKLPGGGIDENENKIDAIRREMLEETGCVVEITAELGIVIEERSVYKQTNYCYLGKIIKKGIPHFSDTELSKGYELRWLTLDQAISAIDSDSSSSSHGVVLLEREKLILETVKGLLT